jgi:signal transduction histidine kinase/ligand-binding sensor domain-containing protein
MTRNVLSAICFVLFLILGTGSAHGLDPSKRLTQYRHSTWRVQDGYLPSNPSWVSQTADGYLWVGGYSSGTFRFDGVRFVPWSAPASTPSHIYLFLPAKSGGFWIGDTGGVSHVRDNLIVSHFNFAPPAAPTRMIEDEDGSLWVTTTYTSPGSAGPLCHATDREIRCVGKAEGLPIQKADSVLSDGSGGLWVGSDTSLVHWKAGVSEVYKVQALRSNSGQGGIEALVRNSDGSLWVGIAATGRGLGLEQFRDGTFAPFSTPNFDGSKISVFALLVDRDNALWVATVNNGLFRICGKTVDHFGLADGLSSNSVLSLYEDQEGIVWAATSSGLDSFQEPRVTTYSAIEGLGGDVAVSVIASHDGTIWLANAESLDSIHKGTVHSIGIKDGLPGHQVTSLLEDREGHLWVGVDDRLFIYENSHFRPALDSPGPLGMIVGITEDVHGDIWAECASKQRKLIRIRDFKMQEEFSDSQVPPGHTLAADPSGGIWLGTLDGGLASFRKGAIHIYPINRNAFVGQIEVQQDGSVIAAAAEDGLISLRGGAVQRLTKQNGLPCTGVIGFARDNYKNWWLDTPCGYVELTDLEIQKWRVDPTAVLQFRFLDNLDGARTGSTPFNPAAKAPDGSLWFVSAIVVQTVDPTRLGKGSSARPVYVESVTADRAEYKVQNSLTLPALTHDIQIDYTSPSLSIPKKVKFRYRLEGSDSTWQDAGTRRQAFYTNLRPGQYRFKVIDSNEDGVWNIEGAALQFSIAPAWFQTIWFRSLCVIGFLLLLWGLYQMRLRQVRHQFDLNLEARVNERTRIARELHDTLLQNFQASLVQMQAARNLFSKQPEKAVRTLDDAIDMVAGAIDESRDAIQGLRSVPMAKGSLAELLTATSQDLAKSQNAQPIFDFIEEGERRTLSAASGDEICRIAVEILRNAYRHANAHHIEAEVRYEEQIFRLRIRDDGKGMDPKVLKEGGVAGHFGLRGIRERAHRIGATLDIWTEVGAGTEAQLTVPGTVAYENASLRKIGS